MLTLNPDETEVLKCFSLVNDQLYSLFVNRFGKAKRDAVVEALERTYYPHQWTTSEIGLLYCYDAKQDPMYLKDFHLPDSSGSCVVYRCRAKHWAISNSSHFCLAGKLQRVVSEWDYFLKESCNSDLNKGYDLPIYAREVMPIERVA